MIYSKISGIGSYLPEKLLTNADLEKMIDTSDEWIVTRTGIKQRHISREDEFVSDMSTAAAKRAIEDAGLTPLDIDLIIVCTITPDLMTPSTACIVQSNLGAKNAGAFDMSAACSGFLYGMTIADGLIRTGGYKNIVVIGSEALSKVTDWEDRGTCILFGDGAGAAVISASETNGILSSYTGANGESGKVITLQNLASPDWDNEQRQGQDPHKLYMNGNEVYKFAVKIMVDAVNEAINRSGYNIDEIDFIIPHQANLRIIDGATKRLKVSEDKVYKNIEMTGNISAACIPVALDQAYREGKIKKGDKIAMVGFGAGLTWASSVIEWMK